MHCFLPTSSNCKCRVPAAWGSLTTRRESSYFIRVMRQAASTPFNRELPESTWTNQLIRFTILKPGEHFGELSPSGDGQRTQPVSVKAETPVDLVTIRRNDFERVAETVTSLRAMIHKSEAALTGYEALMTMAKEQPRLAS